MTAPAPTAAAPPASSGQASSIGKPPARGAGAVETGLAAGEAAGAAAVGAVAGGTGGGAAGEALGEGTAWAKAPGVGWLSAAREIVRAVPMVRIVACRYRFTHQPHSGSTLPVASGPGFTRGQRAA